METTIVYWGGPLDLWHSPIWGEGGGGGSQIIRVTFLGVQIFACTTLLGHPGAGLGA